MKYLFGILTLFFLISCDEIPDEVINSNSFNFSITNVEAPELFIHSQTNSSFVTAIEIDKIELVSEVWLDILSRDGSEEIINNANMKDDGDVQNNGDEVSGDGKYSTKIALGGDLSSGNYEIQFFVKDNFNDEGKNVKKAAVRVFSYDNGQTNFPPEISDLDMPASVVRIQTFNFTLVASDPNGLNDIDAVYFDAFRPDNSALGRNLMHDDGNSNFGDITAGDGIYSFRNFFAATAPIGTWRFEFQARDKNGLLSDKIIHNIEVD